VPTATRTESRDHVHASVAAVGGQGRRYRGREEAPAHAGTGSTTGHRLRAGDDSRAGGRSSTCRGSRSRVEHLRVRCVHAGSCSVIRVSVARAGRSDPEEREEARLVLGEAGSMKLYTYSTARQRLAEVLEEASREGEIQIRCQDGRVYAVTPLATSAQSPFANVTGRPVKGVTATDLLRAVREEGAARRARTLRSARRVGYHAAGGARDERSTLRRLIPIGPQAQASICVPKTPEHLLRGGPPRRIRRCAASRCSTFAARTLT